MNDTDLIFMPEENVKRNQSYVTEMNVTEYVTHKGTHVIDYMQIVMLFSWLFAIVLCVATVSFGIVSWVLIAKWRQFRNYVFINVSFAGGLFTTVSKLNFLPRSIYLDIITMFGISSFVFWLFITSFTFYVDVVKIFSYNYEHVYVKSNAFAWGLPALILAVDYLFYIDLTEFAMIGISFTSIALYCRVLYTLMKRAKVRGSSHMTLWKKMKIATFIFLVSGCAMMLPMHLANQVGLNLLSLTVIVTVILLQIMAINILFLMMKSHRNLWREYLERRRVRNDSRLQLQPRVISNV